MTRPSNGPHTEERPGNLRQETTRAAQNTITHEGEPMMTKSTFTPGDQEHTTETITDIDGEVYPGETLKLKKSMTFYSPEPELEGNNPVKSDLHLYGVTYGPPEQENRVEALRLLVVDPMGHDAWIDVAAPYQLEKLGEWLIREAQALQGGAQ